MQHANFIQSNPATHFAIDIEDFQAIAEFDELCEANWPIWVCKLAGHPVAWFDEAQDIAFIR